MKRRVLIAGHWSGGSPSSPTALAALEELSRGFLSAAAHWEVEMIPFGPGQAFQEAVSGARSSRYAPIVVPDDEQGSAWAGRKAREALESDLVPILEGGHPHSVDCGIGFISSLSGIEVSDPSTLEQTLPHALSTARKILAGRDMIAAASTRRPLLGMSSVLALDPELNARSVQDRGLTSLLTRLLSTSEEKTLPLLGTKPQPKGAGRIPGSGAGGGVGAMVLAIGGRIIDTGLFLRDFLRLDERIADAELVLVLEAKLHSPNLSDSFLDVICDAAAQHALPVVAIGAESSLSAHERAQWGLNGQFITEGKHSLFQAGARIAQTWGR